MRITWPLEHMEVKHFHYYSTITSKEIVDEQGQGNGKRNHLLPQSQPLS